MTINNSSRTAGPFPGNGVTVDFPFSYKVFSRTDLLVAQTVTATGIETIKIIDGDYTVTLNTDQDSNPGGTIHMLVAPPIGTTLSATSAIEYTQNLDLTNGGGFYPTVINNALDRIVIQIQQLGARIGLGALNVGAAATIATVMSFISNLSGAAGTTLVNGTWFGGAVTTVSALGTSIGSSLLGFIQAGIGAVMISIQTELRLRPVTPQQFGALGDNVADDSDALEKMWATGKRWYIPYTAAGYKITRALTITSSGTCDGQLVMATGFVGIGVSIVNPVYGRRLHIFGLDVYSTDIRPNPYTAAKTTGILIGPNATYSGNTPCPGVTLYSCKSQRFSVNLQISTFNVSIIGGLYPQGDHNVLVYSYDTTYNQINDVSLTDVQMDSPMAGVGKIAYSLRVGTIGDAVYTGNANMGVNLRVEGCNFDGGAVYIDNLYGVNYQSNYHEQPSVYTYLGGAVVMGSAGATYLRNVYIGRCWFTNFDYAIDVVNQVQSLTVDPNSYATIKYSAVRLGAVETQSFKYRNGNALGGTTWASGRAEVLTNFSGGIAIGQLTFTNVQIENDYLNNGSQVAPSQSATTNWYPYGLTNDGWKHASSSLGRFRSGAAVQTAIAGTQAGLVFTFTTLTDAVKFNGGDRISASAGGATFIKSVNPAAGTAVLDSAFAGAVAISHSAASFIGVNLYGNGSPNGAVTAIPGSIYQNTAGGALTTLWVKESGTGNVGWVAK